MSADLDVQQPVGHDHTSPEPASDHSNGNLANNFLNSKSPSNASLINPLNFFLDPSTQKHRTCPVPSKELASDTSHNYSCQISHGFREQSPCDPERKGHYRQWFGPVGQSVQNQTAKTSSEFQDLANARQTPATPAATGQPLTHYHSMFYRLLSWKNPRATAISFAIITTFIFAARYVNVLRYTFKALYIVLGITAAAEVAGHMVLGDGLASRLRPKTYFVIPKESLERALDDIEQLINFFVIEFQRVVFAENIWATLLAFISSFISYWLIKWLPLWGLALIFNTFLFLGPLIYIKNQALIDEHLSNAKNIAAAQANQVRDMAAQHTGRATESLKGYTSEYTKKAQEMMGQSTAKPAGSNVQAADFPTAPKEEPVAAASEPEPVPAL